MFIVLLPQVTVNSIVYDSEKIKSLVDNRLLSAQKRQVKGYNINTGNEDGHNDELKFAVNTNMFVWPLVIEEAMEWPLIV